MAELTDWGVPAPITWLPRIAATVTFTCWNHLRLGTGGSSDAALTLSSAFVRIQEWPLKSSSVSAFQ